MRIAALTPTADLFDELACAPRAQRAGSLRISCRRGEARLAPGDGRRTQPWLPEPGLWMQWDFGDGLPARLIRRPRRQPRATKTAISGASNVRDGHEMGYRIAGAAPSQ